MEICWGGIVGRKLLIDCRKKKKIKGKMTKIKTKKNENK